LSVRRRRRGWSRSRSGVWLGSVGGRRGRSLRDGCWGPSIVEATTVVRSTYTEIALGKRENCSVKLGINDTIGAEYDCKGNDAESDERNDREDARRIPGGGGHR